MTTLILTVAGSDRPGLVAAVADIVDAHGGNWESSQLAELAGVFAGVIQVSVAPERENELQEALQAAVKDGTIDVIATDHAPHHYDEKEREFADAPNGIIGLAALGADVATTAAAGLIFSDAVVGEL